MCHWLLRHTTRSNNLPRVALDVCTITVRYKAASIKYYDYVFLIYLNLKFHSVGNSKCSILWLNYLFRVLNNRNANGIFLCHIALPSLWHDWRFHIFRNYLGRSTVCGKKFTLKCILILSVNCIRQFSPFRKNSVRYYHKRA